MWRWWLVFAAAHGFISVACGAFGAHGLRGREGMEPRYLEAFETGARYEMYHALALIAVAWLATRNPSGLLNASGACFAAGACVFSFSLYLLALTQTKWLGAITPIGGLAMLAGWVLLATAAIAAKPPATY